MSEQQHQGVHQTCCALNQTITSTSMHLPLQQSARPGPRACAYAALEQTQPLYQHSYAAQQAPRHPLGNVATSSAQLTSASKSSPRFPRDMMMPSAAAARKDRPAESKQA